MLIDCAVLWRQYLGNQVEFAADLNLWTCLGFQGSIPIYGRGELDFIFLYCQPDNIFGVFGEYKDT